MYYLCDNYVTAGRMRRPLTIHLLLILLFCLSRLFNFACMIWNEALFIFILFTIFTDILLELSFHTHSARIIHETGLSITCHLQVLAAMVAGGNIKRYLLVFTLLVSL